MIRTPYEPAAQKTKSYVHLMRAAGDLFKSPTLDRLSPRIRSQASLSETAATPQSILGLDAIAATEHIAYDFLARGGKHSRPFITLAAYDAISGGACTESHAEDALAAIPDSVRRAAMCIETFHKASLVHDDIEDDDGFRYGQPTVHRRFGLPTAINVGDYLIGLGYRLLSRSDDNDDVPPAARVDVLDSLAAAHLRLSEGQGAELLWRDAKQRRLKPLDALKVYALKTSPAFEAALYSGIRLAGDAKGYRDAIRSFSRNLGVAFQILNDLGDFTENDSNKVVDGGDLIGGRPTILWALALEALDDNGQEELLSLADPDSPVTQSEKISRIRQIYHSTGVFDTAFSFGRQASRTRRKSS